MKAFTLIELMVVILVFTVIMGAIFGVMRIGKISWHSGNTQVEVQQETRKGMSWIVRELRESNSTHVSITGGGSIITFQVPVDYDNDGAWRDIDNDNQVDYIWDLTDNNGNIEWGAPLHICCRAPHCEGQNDNCHYLNYSIRYLVSNDQLLRRVLNGYPSGSQIREDVLANNISSDTPPPNALMFTANPTINPTLITIELTAQKDTMEGETMQSTLYSEAYLRN